MILNPTHQNWCELNIGALQLVGIHVYNFSGYLISDCHILLFSVCCASTHLGLSLDQTVACDSPITQNVKNQPVAVANLWILFPPTPVTQLCLQTGCTRFDRWGLTLKTGFPRVTSVDSVVSSTVFLPAHWRKCCHPVDHTHLTHRHLLHGQSAHICQLHAAFLSIYHILVKWHFYSQQLHAHCVQDMLCNILVSDWQHA